MGATQGGGGALRVVALWSSHLVDEHIALTVVARDEACTYRGEDVSSGERERPGEGGERPGEAGVRKRGE